MEMIRMTMHHALYGGHCGQIERHLLEQPLASISVTSARANRNGVMKVVVPVVLARGETTRKRDIHSKGVPLQRSHLTGRNSYRTIIVSLRYPACPHEIKGIINRMKRSIVILETVSRIRRFRCTQR